MRTGKNIDKGGRPKQSHSPNRSELTSLWIDLTYIPMSVVCLYLAPVKLIRMFSQFWPSQFELGSLLLMQDSWIGNTNTVARQQIVLRDLLPNPFSRAIHVYVFRQLV